jgi:hypothetical protein
MTVFNLSFYGKQSRCITKIYHEQLHQRCSQAPAQQSRTRHHLIRWAQTTQHRAVHLSPSFSDFAQNCGLLIGWPLGYAPFEVAVGPCRIFPLYKVVTPEMSTESDDAIARQIANQVSLVPEEEEQIRFGYFIKGFPFNTNQALQLDRYLNGVNLALHLRTEGESSDYLSSIKSLLTYYSDRVLHLSL